MFKIERVIHYLKLTILNLVNILNMYICGIYNCKYAEYRKKPIDYNIYAIHLKIKVINTCGHDSGEIRLK